SEPHRPPPPPAQHRPALVGDDDQEPGPDVVRVAELREAPPRLEGRLLDGVLRGVVVAEHAVREAVRRRDEGPDQLLEGLLVAGPGLRDEVGRVDHPERTDAAKAGQVAVHRPEGEASLAPTGFLGSRAWAS